MRGSSVRAIVAAVKVGEGFNPIPVASLDRCGGRAPFAYVFRFLDAVSECDVDDGVPYSLERCTRGSQHVVRPLICVQSC